MGKAKIATTKKRARPDVGALLMKLRSDPTGLALVIRVIEELAKRSPKRPR